MQQISSYRRCSNAVANVAMQQITRYRCCYALRCLLLCNIYRITSNSVMRAMINRYIIYIYYLLDKRNAIVDNACTVGVRPDYPKGTMMLSENEADAVIAMVVIVAALAVIAVLCGIIAVLAM